MKITSEVKKEVSITIEQFNQKHNCYYKDRYRGEFLYLEKADRSGGFSKIGRLKYNGETDDWSFSVFKYSSESYDPDEIFFPGQEFLDGTVDGALRAGLEIYP